MAAAVTPGRRWIQSTLVWTSHAPTIPMLATATKCACGVRARSSRGSPGAGADADQEDDEECTSDQPQFAECLKRQTVWLSHVLERRAMREVRHRVVASADTEHGPASPGLPRDAPIVVAIASAREPGADSSGIPAVGLALSRTKASYCRSTLRLMRSPDPTPMTRAAATASPSTPTVTICRVRASTVVAASVSRNQTIPAADGTQQRRLGPPMRRQSRHSTALRRLRPGA